MSADLADDPWRDPPLAGWGAEPVEDPGPAVAPLAGDRSESGEFTPPPGEPMAVARRLLADQQVDGVLTLRRWRGGWVRWGGSCWAEVEDSVVRAEVYSRLEHARWLDDGGPQLQVKPWSPTRYKIANVMEALAAIAHLPETVDPPAWLTTVADQPPAGEMVSCRNGVLHVRTRRLLPATPGFFNLAAVPFDHDEGAPPPVRWLRFLDELFPDDAEAIAALQEFFGYVLSGRTDLHKIALIVGPTRSGKGTIARVLGALVGARNVAGPTLASLGSNFGLAPLLGKPLALVSDARLGRGDAHQVVERLLSISGEDTLTVDRKYREPWTGRLGARFLILSNELPRFGDASGAVAGRFLVLQLHRSWLGRENSHLTQELTRELPGILGWALDGLDRLAANDRFTEPASSVDAIVALHDLVSPVAAFVRQECSRGPGLETGVGALFSAWRAWCEENGHRPGSAQTFGRDLRAVVPALRTVRPRDGHGRERCYQGLALADPAWRPIPGHSDEDRGPSRTRPVVRDGPRSNPLSVHAAVDPAPAGPTVGSCARCGTRCRRYGDGADPLCAECRRVAS